MLINVCTYGLFRKGEANYNYVQCKFGPDSILYLKTIKIPGYKMYDCIFNPTIERTLNKEEYITVDLLRVNDDVYQYIEKIDSGGKFFEDYISIDDVNYSIFLEVDIETKYREHLIENGDWKSIT